MTAETLLLARAKVAREFLLDGAFDLWWRAGFDASSGLFHDKLRLDGTPDFLPRRTRVQARQAFVYATAGDLGWTGPWREACTAGAAAVLRARRDDGGFIHKFSADGATVLDGRRDLYDSAFAAFALAHSGRALGRTDLLAASAETLTWIDDNWAHPSGGYLEGEIDSVPPRRQNPHMHLFEATLALFEATGDAAAMARAGKIADLFGDRFFDRVNGALPEYFTEDWTPADGIAGQTTESGHHFEWAWLIARWNARGGRGLMNEAERLIQHGEAFGVDRSTGATIAEVSTDGVPLNPKSRFWAHTERIKAHVSRFERTRDPVSAEAAAQAFDVLMRYCDMPVKGTWRDWMNPDGSFVEESAPASSFYHLTLAFAELIRVAETTATA
jgi:mannose/cellobiose epimerase-like protein (N-acyl-D-glucosamine 2-epimerase family)